jgi:putative FmdB family regulatory protein
MPLISFKCNECSEEFDAFRRLRDGTDSGPPCPKCGAANTVCTEDFLDEPCGISVGTDTIR